MERRELKIWAKVYKQYRHNNYLSLIEDGYNYFTEISMLVWKLLSKARFSWNYNKCFDTKTIIEITYDFLGTIDSGYPKLLNEYINKGIIDLYDKDNEVEKNRHRHDGAHYNFKRIEQYDEDEYIGTNYHKNIVVPLHYNIYDVYSLVHEFFHSISIYHYDYQTFDEDLFTEAVSITYEFILFDYLKDKFDFDEIKGPINRRLNDLLNKSKYLANGLTIYNKISNDRELLDSVNINKDDIKEIDERYKSLFKAIMYFVGTIIAIINYKNYKEGKTTIERLEDFNHSISNYNNLESLTILFETLPKKKEIEESITYVLEDLKEEQNKEKNI